MNLLTVHIVLLSLPPSSSFSYLTTTTVASITVLLLLLLHVITMTINCVLYQRGVAGLTRKLSHSVVSGAVGAECPACLDHNVRG